jgi:hypothetical protein
LNGCQSEHFLADALIAPGVALETLATDADHFDAWDEAHLQLERQFGSNTFTDPSP